MKKKNKSTIKAELRRLAHKETAKILQRFFKTGPGEYGEGDRFLGIKVPPLRKLAHSFSDLALSEIEKHIKSPYHEERLVALMILVRKFSKEESEKIKKDIFKFYIKNMKYINNWDLVDLSCEYIIGPFLEEKDRKILLKWAKSKNLWTRRIAMISTLHFIRKGDFKTTLKLAKILLKDEHDLIHKASGWLLREIGKRDHEILTRFLKEHYHVMPRTMLRYAIEKFPESLRKAYLKGTVS